MTTGETNIREFDQLPSLQSEKPQKPKNEIESETA